MSDSLSPRDETPVPPALECKCISEMNEHLKPHGGEILINLFGPPRAFISTHQLDAPKGKRKPKVPYVMATFCPFCGVKYPRSEVTR